MLWSLDSPRQQVIQAERHVVLAQSIVEKVERNEGATGLLEAEDHLHELQGITARSVEAEGRILVGMERGTPSIGHPITRLTAGAVLGHSRSYGALHFRDRYALKQCRIVDFTGDVERQGVDHKNVRGLHIDRQRL